MSQRILDPAIFQQWALPIALQSQQAVRETLRIAIAEVVAAIFAQDFGHLRSRVPAQCAPDGFVDVIVAAFRISNEPDGAGLQLVEDGGLALRAWVDAFA